jgi:hypothetical protein
VTDDSSGVDRPSPSPADAELVALTAAFEAGNFNRVRVEAPRLIGATHDAGVKKAAEDLLARTRPDPLAVLLLAVTAALLVALSAWWVTHDGGAP